MSSENLTQRRQFIKYVLAAGTGVFLSPFIFQLHRNNFNNAWASDTQPLIQKPIPSTGEMLTAIGMGTWQTFSVGGNATERANCKDILEIFFRQGGGMIDSSPMYGSSEEVLGYCLSRLGEQPGLFSASKIWHMLASGGKNQFKDSQKLWGLKTFDLFQVHNLLNWKDHLKTLRDLKEKGVIRYLGITTSHGRRHKELIQLMHNEPMDFVQLTYNITHREVEEDILPLALEKKIAVIANRPYDGGALMDRYKQKPMPAWAREAHCSNWAQFFLKYIIAHPAVTCAIPATSKTNHMKENMSAAYGSLPDQKMRRRMAAYIQAQQF